MTARKDGRADGDLRELSITVGASKYAEGSALIKAGDTHVFCTASVEEKVPPFLYGQKQGWVTAEYGMLPRATHTRSQREVTKGKPSGRTSEIQRLIGRSLRAVVDMTAFGEKTIWIDCDVLQADGGTRCASITGAYVAMAQAFQKMKQAGAMMIRPPLTGQVAAISVGMIEGRPILDLCYEEDSKAGVDMNVVRTEAGCYIEVQGTAEASPFTRAEMDRMLALADTGLERLLDLQRRSLGDALTGLLARPLEVG